MVIGIDPGVSGGIAWYQKGHGMNVVKMPQTETDLFHQLEEIRAEAEGGQILAYIEEVHAGLFGAGRMGMKASFTFGKNLGHLEMALVAAKIPFVRVRPAEWQKFMKCMSGGDKNVTKRRAQQLFPDKKVIHATADALLIAYYGASINGANNVF